MNANAPVFEKAIGLLIEPLDPLFFRDGRPFEAASRGSSGLPMPRTLYGMLRYHLFEQVGLKRNEIHTLRQKPDHPHHWMSWIAVRGPWLATTGNTGRSIEEVYVQPPAHVMQVGKADGEYVTLRPLRDGTELPGWNLPSPYGDPKPLRPLWAGAFGKDLKPISGRLIGKAGLTELLKGKDLVADHLKWQSDLWVHEERVGVAIHPGKQTAAEGQLYTTSMIRLKNRTAFYAEVGIEGDKDHLGDLRRLLGGEFIAPFGGEGRRVRVQTLDNAFTWPEPQPVPDKEHGGFFAMQLSPTAFTPSEYHGSVTDERLRRQYPPNPLGSLIAAAVPRAVPESGWELLGIKDDPGYRGRAAGMPRPTRYAIPAGATTFWQSGNGATKEVLHRWQLGQTPLDRAAGYGTALRGIWHYWKK